MGWIFVGSNTAALVVGSIIVGRKSPDLLLERNTRHKDAKSWDKVLSPFIALGGPVLIWMTAGLDKRFQWSPEISQDIQIAGLATTLIGMSLVVWSMVSNKFFSGVVRIQSDRGHSVADCGPYRYVRHPGYAGFIVTYLTTPLALGSLWALLPGGITVCVTVIRTWLEDQTLKEELDGYKAYADRVIYQLVPGLW